MCEEFQKVPQQANIQSDSLSFDLDDNNFFSSQINPENIFNSEVKDSSEIQLASKILCFPFNLDFFKLIFLKDEKDPELIDPFCTVILGDIEKLRFSESVLKMVFYSKDRRTPLNLYDYMNEIQSLTKLTGIEFICICMNKMFIQCEDDNTTKEAYNSLQKNYNSSDFLYDEDYLMNSFENQNKGNNSLLSSEKKSDRDIINYEEVLSQDKTSKKLNFFNEPDEKIFSEKNDFNTPPNNCSKEIDIFNKAIWNSEKKLKKEHPIPEEAKKDETTPKQQKIFNQFNSPTYPSQSFSPLFFPIYNLYNNMPKPKLQVNPLLLMQYSKMNPFLFQTAFPLQQNMLKFQQVSLNSNEKKNMNNINENFNGKNIKIKNETEKGSLISNNKESSTNSNTSSSVSSKESSPTVNYQNKSYSNTNKMNIHNINFGLFNGFNNMNSNQNINIINNNKMKNNKEFNNDLLNLPKFDGKNVKSNSPLNQEGLKINSNLNLQQIVINNTFKEYVPKSNSPNTPLMDNSTLSENNNIQNSPQMLEKGVEFHTNSTRDYQYKYVSRYIVQIENEKNFPVTKMIIGNSGKLLRDILVKNCINNGDYTTKIRLRGKGSGYKEGPKNEESKDPMELCISSLNIFSYYKCSQDIENLLRGVYHQYYLYQCNNKKNNSDNNDNCPIVMKKILKYQYVVNRYNTLAKEEKRRKKEEEMKQVNQVNKNNVCNNVNDNNFINHE